MKSTKENGTDWPGLGIPRRRAYCACWYLAFRQEEQRLTGMGDVEPFEDDPAWQMLPLARREDALKRLKSMLEYEERGRTDEASTLMASNAMGVTMNQFYRVRRQWIAKRSIFSLLPFGRPGAGASNKLDPHVYEAVRKLILEALQAGERKAAKILRRIYADWPLETPAPSHVTIRRFIAEELIDFEGLEGNLVLNNNAFPQEESETARYFGEVVIIDHSPLSIFVAQPLKPTTPVVSFAIDLFTRSILSFHISAGRPGPDEFLTVISKAEEATKRVSPTDAEPIRPRLVFACTNSPAWNALLDRIARSGIAANVRKSPNQHWQGMVRRLIGGSIGSIRFLNRNTKNFQRAHDALVDLEQLTAMIEAGAQDINRSRLPSDPDLRPLKFDI